MFTIPRHLITSGDSDIGDLGPCLVGVSMRSVDTSRRQQTSTSSKSDKRKETNDRLVCKVLTFYAYI